MCSSTSNEFPCCSATTRSYHCCCMAFWACSRSDCVMEVLPHLAPPTAAGEKEGLWESAVHPQMCGPHTPARDFVPCTLFNRHSYYEALRCCFCSLYSWLSCVISAFASW